MPNSDSYPDGEENVSPSPNHGKLADQAGHGVRPGIGLSRSCLAVPSGFASGSGEDEETGERQGRAATAMEESGRERSGGEQGQEDVDMNSSHDSSSGNESRGESRLHSVSANQSPGSTTGSGSSKSWKSGPGSPLSSPHRTCCSQDGHLTVGSEQVEQDREHAHREMMQTVQEMKKRLPSDKRSRSKASTMDALNYALNCVRQVQANSEYYNLLMCYGLEERKDAAVCTLEQLESITSEHTLKNTDTFVVVFSLVTGRVVYASEQASSILNCKRKFLDSAKFVELLFHQDVNVFYAHTAQPHLPPWTISSSGAAVLFECAQVKSFFCRIRGGKDREGEMHYCPFRITPYLLRVRGVGGKDEQPCCLALAEQITSGYEAPRIPSDKRVFSSTHSPGCVFLEMDDRAVPLLGYLPQDLIGTSLLTCLHPEDRALMLAIHRKILKYAGQPPFEHSPVRFRCQNGDYVTLDTSWSSFVNPWNRKVAFIIGRHKVRTGPLNEDVFAAPNKAELPVVHEDVKVLQATIYKLFLQPVHTNGSSGYGSLGSNGSHEHYVSVASSSDSNGNLWEDTHREPVHLRQICADVNKVKSSGQQNFLESRMRLTPIRKAATDTHAPLPHGVQCPEVPRLQGSLKEVHRKQPHVPSYQQINCVDSIIRYLESCSVPALKRKMETRSIATSSSSSTSDEGKTPAAPTEDAANADEVTLQSGRAPDGPVSTSSSATVAHTTAAVVGAPLTDITLSDKAMSVVSVTSQCSYSSTIVHVPQPESEVTALEDAPMGSEPADPAPGPAHTVPSSSPAAPEELQVVGLTKEVLSAHTQKEEQDYVDRLRHRILESPYNSYLQQDSSSMAPSNHRGDSGPRPLSAGGWHRSHSGKHKHKRAKPQASSDSEGWPVQAAPLLYGHCGLLSSPAPNHSSSEQSPPRPFVSPMLMPIQPPIQPPYYPATGLLGAELPPAVPILPPAEHVQLAPPVVQVANPFMAPVMAVILPYAPTYAMYSQGVAGVTAAPVGTPPFTQAPFVSVVTAPPQPCPSGMPLAPTALLGSAPVPPPCLGGEELDATQPTALFSSSRSSSPLQLNLLQEELPKPAELQSSTARPESSLEKLGTRDEPPSESGNQDAQSTSSVLLDLLLQEDARSGTGSNASGSGSGESGGSLGSGSALGSNGTSTSHTGSSNSSKYFASNDSSDTSQKIRKSQEVAERGGVDHSLWAKVQHIPEPVMMTYQIRPRDPVQVLEEDREKLLLLRPMQPWFSQEQREELAEVHSWIQRHTLPKEINTQGCVTCNASNRPALSRDPPTSDSLSPQDSPTEDISPASNT